MSTLKNKETSIKKSEDEMLNYAFLIEQCISVAPEKGFSVPEMKKRLSIHEVITNTEVGKDFTFKAEDVMTIKSCVTAMQWAVMHNDIVEFADAVAEL